MVFRFNDGPYDIMSGKSDYRNVEAVDRPRPNDTPALMRSSINLQAERNIWFRAGAR